MPNDPKLSLIRTQMPFSRGFGNVNASYTFSTLWALDGHFDLVRLVYPSLATSAATIDAAAIAPSARIGDGYSPTDAAGSAVAFTPVTFGAAAGTPTYAPGGSATGTIPASDGTTPAYCFSDWMRVPSLERLDEGSDGRPLLMARTHFSGSAGSAPNSASLASGWPAQDGGRLLRSYYKSGTAVVSGFTNPIGPNNWIIPGALQFYTRGAGITVLSVGDSLTQGQDVSTSEFWAPGHFATLRLSSLRRPVSFVNAAQSGFTSDAYAARGRDAIDKFLPEVVTISVWSPNDPKTQADADAAFSRALALAEYARSKGAVPILTTAVPFQLPASTDAYRVGINNRARRMAADGTILLADFDAAVADPTDATLPRPEYRAASGAHLSAAGYRRCGEALERVLARLIGRVGADAPVILPKRGVPAENSRTGLPWLHKPSHERFGTLPTI